MAASPYSCVLWDVDGTIADASAGILPRLVEVFASFGLPAPDASVLSSWIGPPMLESFRVHAGLSAADAEEAVRRYRDLAARDGYAASVSIYPGIREVLTEVFDAGIPQSTASTKPENQVAAILEHYGLRRLFTALSGADANGEGKSVVVARALERLSAAGADISRPVLVGDRYHDVEGAAEHGIPVIFVDWGFGDAGEAHGAIARAGTARDLVPLLLS
ncbi:HAD-IA family hydrolase [Microbacterium pseudoresistens]|uniref:Phosphoglycolate phosphatase n=1 Tax=Microbacterium pseudoresistens TaxID=640634 RepID=A0A7Y9JM48_9MICO|nr:HAD hydrolase-like protein [Microbacterium pseudoresistens]NYD54010.1 phosphoglycolate phosphatase [Microbacterium pseudoresistens]